MRGVIPDPFAASPFAGIADSMQAADSGEGAGVTTDVNVLALFKDRERFIYVFDDDSRAAAIDAIRDDAANPAVAVNWFDAAVLAERARQQGMESGKLPSRV